MAAQKEGRFYTITTASDDELESKRLSLLERKIKRQIMSAYDDATRQAYECEQHIEDFKMALRRKAVKELNINGIVTESLMMRKYVASQEELKALYLELFGTEMQELV